jgi:hypothetical protein
LGPPVRDCVGSLLRAGGESPRGPGFKSRRPHHPPCSTILRTFCPRRLCPHLVREHVVLAYLGVAGAEFAPRPVSFHAGPEGCVLERCWLRGVRLDEVMTRLLVDGRVGEALELAMRAGGLLARLHGLIARCVSPACRPSLLGPGDVLHWCREAARWAGFLYTLGFI